MEHERIEGLEEAQVGRRQRASDQDSADRSSQTDMQSLIGNQATTSVLQSGSPSVDRLERRSQGAGPLDAAIGSEISAARGGGRPMDDDVRADMEGHIGADFSNVRIHADAQGDALSRSVQAEAFTTGTDVFFRSGKYQPTTSAGRGLVAHELTHVVQQSTGQTSGAGKVSHPDDAHEVEARAVGDSVASSSAVDRDPEEEEEIQTSTDPSISREEMPEEEEPMADST